jgi:autotransporter-associated beta strand protein
MANLYWDADGDSGTGTGGTGTWDTSSSNWRNLIGSDKWGLLTLATARYYHTATLLNSGKVLVTGGVTTGTVYLSSCELYDPETNSWSTAGSLATARYRHTATLLPNGKVLVAGGYNGTTYFASCEIYDPETNTWSTAGSLTTGRSGHTATLLTSGTNSGKVLVAGGSNASTLGTCELYDPIANTWGAAGSLSNARSGHTATLLTSGVHSGKVLVICGSNGSALGTCELYDSTTNTWTGLASLASVRYGHTATLLTSGPNIDKVLVTGGFSGSTYLATCVLYDPATNTWSNAGSLTTSRMSHTATLLTSGPNSGKVLVVGGVGSSSGLNLGSCELYDPTSNIWSTLGESISARSLHTATVLSNGQVLITGGGNSSFSLATCQIYNPAINTWSTAGSLIDSRQYHTATLLTSGVHSGKVLIAGGSNGSAIATCQLYDPATNTWSTAGSLATARYGHTATLLTTGPNAGKVLVAGGYTGATYLASCQLYDPDTNTWSTAASFVTARQYHTATLLTSGVHSGKVLIAGGYNGSAIATCQLYDPATNTWSTAANLATARYGHTATLLTTGPNAGKVLVAGGYSTTTLATCQLYDPETNSWSAAGSLANSRYYHTATLLSNGKVLVFSGAGLVNTNSCELYDPVANTWSSAANSISARYYHTATLLTSGTNSGKVLVVGGYNNSTYVSSCELYDPTANTWSAATSLASVRGNHTATILNSGKVLVTGGTNSSTYVASGELYDPDINTWSGAGSLGSPRHLHTMTLLTSGTNSGKVLVAGGYNATILGSCELYDPDTNSWSAAGSLAAARYRHVTILLPNGKVLVTGGTGTATLASCELYDPATNSWSAAASLAAARYGHTTTVLTSGPNSGKVLVVGGSGSATFASCELYDPATNTWSAAASLTTARYLHTAVLLNSGKVLVIGGYTGTVTTASCELYDPVSNTWSAAGSLPAAKYQNTATLLTSGTNSGKVLVTGGYSGSAYMSSCELYDPATNTWSAAASLTTTRSGHTATLLTSGKVLVTGGYNSYYLSTCQIYDPDTNTWATVRSLAVPRQYHRETLLISGANSGKVLVSGGFNGSSTASYELFEHQTFTLSTWLNVGIHTAYFSGLPGTVTLGSDVLLGNLTSEISGYTINSDSFILNLSSNSTINITTGIFTLNAPVSGSYDLIKSGSGNLVLSSNSTLTGSVRVLSGNLIFSSSGILPDVSNIEITGGTFYSYGNITRDVNLSSGTLSGNSTISSNVTLTSSLSNIIRADSGNLTLSNLIISGLATVSSSIGSKIIASNLIANLSNTSTRFINLNYTGTITPGFKEILDYGNSSVELNDFKLNSLNLAANQVALLQQSNSSIGINVASY